MDFESILKEINFKKVNKDEILDGIPILIDKFKDESRNYGEKNMVDWVMGQLRKQAVGNMNLSKLSKYIK